MSPSPVPGRIRRGLGATLALLCALLAAPAMAHAGVGATTFLTFPAEVTAGQTAVDGKLTVQNANSSTHAAMTNRVCNDFDIGGCDDGAERAIVLTPSCAVVNASGACAAPDLGVFRLSPTATGSAGTCTGKVFDVATVDPTFGRLSFTPRPSGTNVTLPGAGTLCEIAFKFDVLRVPGDQDPSMPGAQTALVTAHTECLEPCSGTALRATVAGTDTITVNRATPAISTDGRDGIVNQPLTGHARVSGLVSPVSYGQMTFKLYPPSNPGCIGAPQFTSTKNVSFASPSVAEATSAPFTPALIGTFRWVASFDGDPNNVPVASNCGAPGTVVNVSLTAPAPPPAPPPPPPVAPPPVPPAPPPPPAPVQRPTCAGKVATIVADGRQVVTGTPGADVIVGGPGAERIDGGGGNDTICSGPGSDAVRGGAGNDLLLGEGGNDLLVGGAGNDELRGATGNDRLGGGAGRDRSDGGTGNDVLDEQVLGGAGSDRLIGGAGADRVRAADRTGDNVDCGAGIDVLTADRRDRVARCERVRRVR